MRLYALQCGIELTDWAVFDPFDDRVGTKVLNPTFVYVIAHPRGRVLIDTGYHPALRTDARSRMGPAADGFDFAMLRPEDDVVARLATLDLRPSDIEHVVLTHLHFDHAGGLHAFAHAPIYVQERELAFAHAPPIYQRDIYVPADFDLGLNWSTLDGDHDLFGDGRVVIFPTPGHTAGHQSVIVHLDRAAVIIAGDAHYTIDKMRQRRLPAILWSPDAMVASWERIEELESRFEASLLVCHDVEFETRVRRAPGEWYE